MAGFTVWTVESSFYLQEFQHLTEATLKMKTMSLNSKTFMTRILSGTTEKHSLHHRETTSSNTEDATAIHGQTGHAV